MPREIKVCANRLEEGLSARACAQQSYSTWHDTIYTKKAVLAERIQSRRGMAALPKYSGGREEHFRPGKKAFNVMSACIFHRRFLAKGHLISLSIVKRSGMYLRAKCLGSKEKPELDSKALRTISRRVMWTRALDSGSYFWLWHLGQVFSAFGISPLLPLFASSG